ncbi:hypothetical protein KIN20_029144 [Parelaphostrongylus tenuis]|uniref:PiggyBac transposable element-derived protein domain-containing protein n=1 Tax=Parelaphostrongylus tenuis TaxID=148309 RepID=A0AAD5R2P7_PARTN|nr:hypothetical protein KIN20_029144 [Parelaphostrongylus tenuis]
MINASSHVTELDLSDNACGLIGDEAVLWSPQTKEKAATSPESGEPISRRLVMYLKEDLLDQGRHVYADNWRTSIHLTEKLLQKNICLTGICKKRRKVTAKGVNAEETAQGRVKSCAKSEWREILIWLSRKKCNDYDSIRLATWIWARISLELLKTTARARGLWTSQTK